VCKTGLKTRKRSPVLRKKKKDKFQGGGGSGASAVKRSIGTHRWGKNREACPEKYGIGSRKGKSLGEKTPLEDMLTGKKKISKHKGEPGFIHIFTSNSKIAGDGKIGINSLHKKRGGENKKEGEGQLTPSLRTHQRKEGNREIMMTNNGLYSKWGESGGEAWGGYQARREGKAQRIEN